MSSSIAAPAPEVCLVELSPEARAMYEEMFQEAKKNLTLFKNDMNDKSAFSNVKDLLVLLRRLCIDLSLCNPDIKIEGAERLFLPKISDLLSPSVFHRLFTDSSETRPPTKVETLIRLLSESRDHKSVVLSTYPDALLLLRANLKAEGFNTLYYDWSLNARDRAHIIEQFQVQKEPVVLLMRHILRSKEDISLTAASRVYFMDPCRKRYEDEAVAACIGQKEAVKFVRLITQNSIEEKILMLEKLGRPPRRIGNVIVGVLDYIDLEEIDFILQN